MDNDKKVKPITLTGQNGEIMKLAPSHQPNSKLVDFEFIGNEEYFLAALEPSELKEIQVFLNEHLGNA